MKILHVLSLLLLLSVPASSTLPSHDHWGESGPYGPCSRTCGTGVRMRTRTCVTSRTDGGHNCLGSSKYFQTCNTHECPSGSKDFREEQCSQFDTVDFRGKRYTWLPYYGGSNPCELNCVPSGENFFYRHRPKVVDGTPCHGDRSDICVDGTCRVLIHGEFLGLDHESGPRAPAEVAPSGDASSYFYESGVYDECSASCGGGTQHRGVECWIRDPENPRLVDESHCVSQRLPRPQSQQACNPHPCGPDYIIASLSLCSVTCGEGQQTGEVVCAGPGGRHLPDSACQGLPKPTSVQPCVRPACKPDAQEACNTQQCPGAQASVQDPAAHRDPVTASPPRVPTPASNPEPCSESPHGCCPDGSTPASGPGSEGCDCVRTRFGCCLDGVTAARGFGRAGCPEYPSVSANQDPPATALPFSVCTLPRDEGPCDSWRSRFYFNSRSGRCAKFWFGGCEGNGNNFVSLPECKRSCGGLGRTGQEGAGSTTVRQTE